MTGLLKPKTPSDRIRRIAWASLFMNWAIVLFMALVIFVAGLALVVLITPGMLGAADKPIDFGDSGRTYGDIPLLQRYLLALFIEFSLAAFFMTLWYLRRMFSYFRKEDFFAPGTMSAMILCGAWFVAYGIMDFLEEPAVSFLTTADLAPDKTHLSLVLEGTELFFVLFGFAFMTLGWVMREAAWAHEENQQFV